MTLAPAPPTAPAVRPGLVMFGVFLALFLASLNQTMVSTALPSIVATMGGIALYSWVFTAYMLTSTVAVPILGKLSDQFGRRPIFVFGIVTFLLGSLLAGFARTMPELIAVRALQGLGAGAIIPIAFAIVGDLYPPEERGRMQGFIGGAFGVSSLIGPLAGGWLTDHWGWRWAFWANLPVGLFALAVVLATLPSRARGGAAPRVDWAGGFLLVSALTPLLLWASLGGKYLAWTGAASLGLLAGGLGFTALFVWAERRAAEPIVPFALFENPVFATIAVASAFSGVLLFGETMFLPLYAQGVLGMSPTYAGLLLTPLMLGIVTGSSVSGELASRLGRYRALAVGGLAVATIAAIALAIAAALHAGALAVALIVALLGAGLGTTFPVFLLAVQNAASRSQLGSVTALVQFFRSIGGTFGVAALGAALTLHVDAGLAARLPDLAAAARPDPQALLAPGAAAGLAPSLLAAVHAALAESLSSVYAYCAVISVGAFLAVLRLEDRPLHTGPMPVAQRAGELLAAEEGTVAGMLRPEDEPDLLARRPES